MLGVGVLSTGTCGRCVGLDAVIRVMAEPVAGCALRHTAVPADGPGPLTAQEKRGSARRHNESRSSGYTQLVGQVFQPYPWLEPDNSRACHRPAAHDTFNPPLLSSYVDHLAIRCKCHPHLVVGSVMKQPMNLDSDVPVHRVHDDAPPSLDDEVARSDDFPLTLG